LKIIHLIPIFADIQVNIIVISLPRYLPKERQVPVSIKAYAETERYLRRLKKLEDMQDAERCRCARFGTVAPPPEEKVPPIGQVKL